MRFELVIELQNDATERDAVQVASLLRKIADGIVRNGVVVSTGFLDRQVTDYSGETVGQIFIRR